MHEILYRENIKMTFLRNLVIYVVVFNALLLKSLAPVSVNHPLETPCLFAWFDLHVCCLKR